MADIRKRRRKLEDDLELLEENIENRFSGIQKKVLGTLKPIETIKKNPFKAVGTSVLIGFAIGLIGRENSSDNGENSQRHKEKMLNLLLNEFKRVAARKAASYLSDFIDERMSKEK